MRTATRLPITLIKRKRPSNGAVLYRGPSALDGSPIVVIVTGIRNKSANAKTGNMLQTWILRADVEPHSAVRSGKDSGVCGDCKHAGTTCYVQVERAPLAVHRAWMRGSYSDWTEAFPAGALADRSIRLGSYGDPAAVPFKVWRRVFAQKLTGWTGYTHQWKNPAHRQLRNYVMASVDSLSEAEEAWSDGCRTFRVRGATDSLTKREAMCPASEEAGKRSSCVKCNLCRGQRSEARSIAIVVHGYRKGNFK